MRSIARRDVVVAALAMGVALTARAAVDETKNLIGPSAYDWTTIAPAKTEVGEVRSFFHGRTATLEELELHVTTLNPGKESHPPHKHPNEEMIIVREGTVECLVDGKWTKLGPGSVIFNASNVLHGIRNAGNTPATYHVINWKTDRTPKE
jgi:XRE family transcriptional regulator, regulator of sulfur utilization